MCCSGGTWPGEEKLFLCRSKNINIAVYRNNRSLRN